MLTNNNVNKTDQITSTVNIRSVRSQQWPKNEYELIWRMQTAHVMILN